MLYQKQIWKLYLNSEDTPLSLSFYNHAQYIYSCLQTGVINRVVKIWQTQHDRWAKEFFEQQWVSYVYASRVVTTHIPSVCPSTLRFWQRDCILFDSIHASKEDASLFQDMYTASDSGTNFVVYGAMYGLCDMFYTPDTYVQWFVLEQTPLAVPCITERLDADMLLFAKK